MGLLPATEFEPALASAWPATPGLEAVPAAPACAIPESLAEPHAVNEPATSSAASGAPRELREIAIMAGNCGRYADSRPPRVQFLQLT
jgi:hypothetical protein